MSAVASKNLFELLGNDPDSDGEIKVPKKEVVKQTTSTKKKDVVVEAPPAAAAGNARGSGGRGGRARFTGTDAAFHDRNAGRENNRAKGTEDGAPRPARSARGGRGGRRDYDRHSQTGRVDSEKQVNQGWGSNDKEWTEEQAGQSIAQAEATNENAAPAGEEAAAVDAEAPAAAVEEPEEKQKTYQDYLAEVAAKKAALDALPQARQPNEGSRTDSKWKNATAVKKTEEDEEAYFAGKEAKARKEKERKQKVIVEIDQRFQEAPRGGRGDRPAGRGGRGGAERGERRGGRGGARGDGAFRGERRGGFAPRAAPAAAGVNLADTSAFPSLGGN